MKVLIATPAFGGQVTTDYCGSLLGTLRWLASQRIEVEVYFLKNASIIGYARNDCAAYALNNNFDKLFFIDADQAWSVQDVERLFSSKHPIVGGTYMKKTLPPDLNFGPLPEHGNQYFPGGVKSAERFAQYANEASATGEVEVAHLPTGFLLIDCSVLRAVAENSPTYLTKGNQHAEETRAWDIFPSGVLNGTYLTEDFFACSLMREAGYKIYLNVHVIVDHLGQINYRLPKDMRPAQAQSSTTQHGDTNDNT